MNNSILIFDVTPFELPRIEDVNWPESKNKIGLFIQHYKTIREQNKLTTIPKLSQQAYLKEDNRDSRFYPNEEFVYTEKCFLHGFSAIMHPFKSEITERRRKVFYFRYMYGLTLPLICDRIHYQSNVVIEESKMSLLQFGFALNLLVKI